MSEAGKLIVLSGIRPTGELHLGNHLGAVQEWIKLSQNPDVECWYFLANLHMLTTRKPSKQGVRTGLDPKELLDDQIGLVLDLLAAGLNPDKSTIYAQTSIPELTELMWLLATLSQVGHLEAMHHFKEKRGSLEKEGISANAALLTYPVLMAADILGVQADVIPVGEDQRAHVEFTRDLARRFNREYGELFPIPDVWMQNAIRVPSIDCSGKMGKSHPDGSVFYRDTKKQIRGKFGRAVKAKENPPRTSNDWKNDPGDPTTCNVFSFYGLMGSDEDRQWAEDGCRKSTIGCGHCKRRMADLVNDLFAPIRERRNELDSDAGRKQALEILHEGGLKARARVQEVVTQAKELVGVPAF